MPKKKVEQPLPTIDYQLRNYFFSHCNPVAVSDLVVCLASGCTLPVERIPICLLPHVVLLATIGLRSYNQQIIDDYELLLGRLEDVPKHKEERDLLAMSLDEAYQPEPYPYHPQGYLAYFISQRGATGEYWLDTHPEAAYMFKVYEELINATPEELFQGVKGESSAHSAAPAARRP